MISFIAIGKNIGQILDKCLLSIEHFCRNNNINNYEIIYVDSNSCDNSVKIALSHTNLIKVIKEAPNAAKARNAGFTMSTGDILFFIDGDMTLESDFYSAVFDNNC